MKPATLPASSPASAAETLSDLAKSKPLRAGDEPVSAYFARVLSHFGVPDDGSVQVWVSIHERNANGQPSSRLGDPVPWVEFDDGDFGRPPGTYVVCLKSAATGKNVIAAAEYRIGGKAILTPSQISSPPAPVPAPAPTPAPSPAMPFDGAAIFGLILQQNQQSQSAMQAQNNTLLQLALQPQQPRNIFEDMLKIEDLLESRAQRMGGGGGGGSWVEGLREVAPLFVPAVNQIAQAIATRRPSPPSPPAASTPPALPAVVSKPAASPPATVPPASDVPPLLALFDSLTPALRLGAKAAAAGSENEDTYANMIADSLDAEGIEADGLSAFAEGQLAAMLAERSGIDVEWLIEVEKWLRDPTREGDDEVEDPPFVPVPPANSKAPKPPKAAAASVKVAGGKKGKS